MPARVLWFKRDLRLHDLQTELHAQGASMLLWVGEVLPALDWLPQRVGVVALHSHQEAR